MGVELDPLLAPRGLGRLAALFRGGDAPADYEAFTAFARELVLRSRLNAEDLSEAREYIKGVLAVDDVAGFRQLR